MASCSSSLCQDLDLITLELLQALHRQPQFLWVSSVFMHLCVNFPLLQEAAPLMRDKWHMIYECISVLLRLIVMFCFFSRIIEVGFLLRPMKYLISILGHVSLVRHEFHVIDRALNLTTQIWLVTLMIPVPLLHWYILQIGFFLCRFLGV